MNEQENIFFKEIFFVFGLALTHEFELCNREISSWARSFLMGGTCNEILGVSYIVKHFFV